MQKHGGQDIYETASSLTELVADFSVTTNFLGSPANPIRHLHEIIDKGYISVAAAAAAAANQRGAGILRSVIKKKTSAELREGSENRKRASRESLSNRHDDEAYQERRAAKIVELAANRKKLK